MLNWIVWNRTVLWSVLLWHYILWWWKSSFEKCGVSHYCYSPQVHSEPEWKHLIGSHLWVKYNSLTFKLCATWPMLHRIVRNPSDCLVSYTIFTNPSARAGCDTRSIFKPSSTGLNSEFSFSKAEEPSLLYYLTIAVGRITRFIPFPRVLVLYEMTSVSSRIWTRVAVSISNDDNHYTTGTSCHIQDTHGGVRNNSNTSVQIN